MFESTWIYYTAETNAVLLLLSLGRRGWWSVYRRMSVDTLEDVSCLVLSFISFVTFASWSQGECGVNCSTELLVLTHANTISQHPRSWFPILLHQLDRQKNLLFCFSSDWCSLSDSQQKNARGVCEFQGHRICSVPVISNPSPRHSSLPIPDRSFVTANVPNTHRSKPNTNQTKERISQTRRRNPMLSWVSKSFQASSPLRHPPNFQDPARQQKTPTDQKTSPGEDLRAQERLLQPAILPVTDQSASDRRTNEASQADARENPAGSDAHFVRGELRRRVTIIC
jgi:hypothetical protein